MKGWVIGGKRVKKFRSCEARSDQDGFMKDRNFGSQTLTMNMFVGKTGKRKIQYGHS